MPEEICYEFDDFRLDPLRRSLFQKEESGSLTPKAFDLLLVFIQRRGEILSKSELIRSVWAEAIVTDNNFNVTLTAVRNALGETAREPRYIIKVPNGYRFVAEIEEVSARADEELIARDLNVASANWGSIGPTKLSPRDPVRHVVHLVVSSTLYAALYAVCILLEVAYAFDKLGHAAMKIAPLAFVWIALSSLAALTLDRKLVAQGRSGGLAVSLGMFLFAAVTLFAGLTRFFPSFPITQASFQTYPAQAAFLKDMAYFACLAFFYMILPYHFVATLEREISLNRQRSVLITLTTRKFRVSPQGTIYPRFWVLAVFLAVLALVSLTMMTHLLDNLSPGPHMNLFTQLVYVRGILYFALGLECLAWYYRALNDLRRECLSLD